MLRLLYLFCFLFLLPNLVAAQAPLREISAYFNGLKMVQARFDQINSDGSRAKGTLYLRRPGRARFEYDPPNEALVLASGGAVAIFDPHGDKRPDTYPLSRTPLSLVLAKNVNFERSGFVRAVGRKGKHTVVTARDPKHPEYGSIDLYFASGPVRLVKWITTNENGERITINLGRLKSVENLGNSLFSIEFEKSRRD